MLRQSGGLEHGPRLHLGDFRIRNAEAAAAMTEHRVELVQFVHAFGNFLHAHAEFFRQRSLRGMVVRQKFVQRRVEESDGRRQTFQFTEHPGEVFALIRQQFRERFLPIVRLLGENHFAHRVDAVALEEHVLGAAETDSRGAERDGVGGLFRIVRVGADLQTGRLFAPLHQLLEVTINSAVFG